MYKKIKLFKSSIKKKKFKQIFNRYKVLKKILPKKNLIIFDVGANDGQTIIEISKNFPKSDVHSFEPLETCKENLLYLKNKIKNLKIHVNFVACGEENKNKFFYINEKSNLSSFLKINTKSKLLIKMKKLIKNKKYLKGINIPVKVKQITLSNYIKDKNIKNIDFLKIDTQGYETNVLSGIKKKDLSKIKTIVVEINFWDYYSKTTSFYDIEKILGKNFKFWDISFIFKNPKYYSTDYVDAIYINKSIYNKI